MKIALVSSYVPFISGGARQIVDWLELMLQAAGHQTEKIFLPQTEQCETLYQQMMAYRWIDLDAADRIICFRPQAHLVPHPHKILWFIHHLRVFYDLWDTPYRPFPDDLKHQGLREALFQMDNLGLQEAKAIFTNSQVVSDRLKTYNKVKSEVLYPPVFQPDRFYCADYSDEIVYVCRVEHHKRQHLLIEAMHHVKTPVRLRISGTLSDPEYEQHLKKLILSNRSRDRILFENRWISEEEKVNQLAHCLAAAYLPLDEDSYGYPSVEASHAQKAILTTTDAGGVLELVQDGVNGYVSEPHPQALAEALDKLYLDRQKTINMGQTAQACLSTLNISWEHVLGRLLA